MSYVIGQEYVGLSADDFSEIIAMNNETVNAWLYSNMALASDGSPYYIYTGDDEMALIEMLEICGAEGCVNYFVFLGSTWSVVGF